MDWPHTNGLGRTTIFPFKGHLLVLVCFTQIDAQESCSPSQMEVLELKGSIPNIGIVARNGVSGPEKNLVEAFQPYISSCFRWHKGSIAIFHEPQMETGFPDLVIIQYNPRLFDKWVPARTELQPMDLKVLHHLIRIKRAETEELSKSLGIKRKTLLSIIDRLLKADVITSCYNKWMPKSLKTIFGIKTIVAIEAKIKNWQDAFQQAEINYWFASESYVLSPIEKPSRAVFERSRLTGVGILLLNGMSVRRVKNARKLNIPSSYGSWMFNEWIGRYLHWRGLKQHGTHRRPESSVTNTQNP